MVLAFVNVLANLSPVYVIWKFSMLSDWAHFEVSWVFKTKGLTNMFGKKLWDFVRDWSKYKTFLLGFPYHKLFLNNWDTKCCEHLFIVDEQLMSFSNMQLYLFHSMTVLIFTLFMAAARVEYAEYFSVLILVILSMVLHPQILLMSTVFL